MTQTRVSPHLRKFAAVGLAAAGVLAVLGFVVEPIASRIIGIDAQIQAKREHLGRLTVIASRSPQNTDAAQLSARPLAAFTLEGETEAVQLATLQTAIGRVAEEAGVRLRSTQALPVMQRDELGFVGLQSTVQVRLEALQRLLYGLETHRPMLLVDAIDMAPITAASGSPETSDDRLVHVNFRVRALVAPTKKGAGQ